MAGSHAPHGSHGPRAPHTALTRRRFLQGVGAIGAAGYLLRGAPLARPARGATGLWSDPSSWPDGRVPARGDVAIVHGSVTLDQNAAVAGVRIEPGSELIFQPDASRLLESTGNVVVLGRLVMHPADAEHEHTLRFVDVDETNFVGGDAGHVNDVRRLGGLDRYATAALIAGHAFDGPVDRAYVATGQDFPDALAAGALGGTSGAPVLLTGRDHLPDVTVDELQRLSPAEVVVVGGTAAISPGVYDALAAAVSGNVRRVAGADRYETAARLAREVHGDGAPVAYLATGMTFPDALAGAVVAARGGGPLLLTGRDGLPDVTREALRSFSPGQVFVFGGAAAVSDAVLTQVRDAVGAEVRRIAGADRYATSVACAQHTFPDGAGVVYLATGEDFPDALAGAPAAALSDGPLLLTARTHLPEVVADEITRLSASALVVLGGDVAIDSSVVNQAAGLLTTGTGADDVPATDVGLWAVGSGVLDLQGTRRTGWNRTGTDATWRLGDETRVAPTAAGDFDTFATFSPGARVPTVGGQATEVFNLTRNVVIEGTPAGRSHVFVRSSLPQSIRHALIRHVGPRGFSDSHQTGRYGLHLHHCGDGSRGTLVEGVVVRDCGNHAFVPHASHGVTFRDCIAYDTREDAYWWDPDAGRWDNATHDTVYDHCMAALVRPGPGSQGFELTGFYLGQGGNTDRTGPTLPELQNACVGCVAVGIGGASVSSGFHWPSTANLIPNVWVFEDCVAHNNVRNGARIWQNGQEDHHPVEAFIAYRNGHAGVDHGAYTNNYTYTDLVSRGNATAFVHHTNGPTKILRAVYEDCAVGIEVTTHSTEPEEERGLHHDVRMVRCATPVRIDDAGLKAGLIDFVCVTVDGRDIEPADVDVVSVHEGSVYRFQRTDGTAFEITALGHREIAAFAATC